MIKLINFFKKKESHCSTKTFLMSGCEITYYCGDNVMDIFEGVQKKRVCLDTAQLTFLIDVIKELELC